MHVLRVVTAAHAQPTERFCVIDIMCTNILINTHIMVLTQSIDFP